ncbi:TIGR03089 family protein [Nocardioides antri]|uniref:TIGR03089 family protein n=1 Tax=Nocardioides antri TaxID=2607659 RepID=A0A5B1M2V8_9ACTN|nr:TIGR03089 family protein [Nocardioides antri]KAA1427114.1 TIGR03089 family protein [Nocardioides antri]
MTTFATVLADRLRNEPGRPLVTFYDDATGERVELSVTTYANWVAKASSLLVDELGLERGDTLLVDLPPHWLTPIFLGAAWSAGLVVTDDEDASAVVCGPDRVDRWAGEAAARVVLACSLRPLGVRFPEPVPPGVHDVGVEIWSQPDAFIPWDPPSDGDDAVDLAGQRRTQQELWETATAGTLVPDGGRLLVAADPASPPVLAAYTEPLVKGGSLVLVTRADQQRLEAIHLAEHTTARFPA